MTDEPELTIKIVPERVIDEGGELNFPEPPQPSDRPTVDAASVEQFHAKEDEAERKARELRELEAALFAHETGRRLLWGILDLLHPFRTTFGETPVGFPDGNATFYHLGQQQAGLALYRKWHAAHPDEVAMMMRENDVHLRLPAEKKTRARKKT